MPSNSASETFTCSPCDVGRFLPTKSGRIGSSRWPRSTSTASWTARGRADRAARVQDVIDENDDAIVEPARRNRRRLQRPSGAKPQIVAIEGDVQGADLDGPGLDALDGGRDTPREGEAARGNAEEDEVISAFVALDDLVRNARDGTADIGVVQDDLRHADLLPRLSGRVLKDVGHDDPTGAVIVVAARAHRSQA
jgi:hypothetical protein